MTYNISRVGLGLKVTTDTGLSYYFANYSVVANPDAVFPSNAASLTIRSTTSILSMALPDIGTIGGAAKAGTVAGVLDQIAMLGVMATAGMQTVTAAGTVAAGATMVSFLNNGTTDGVLLGSVLPAGGTATFPACAGQTYGPIGYDATGTTFIIQTNR